MREALEIPLEGYTWPERFLVASTPFDFARVLPDLSDVSYFADPEAKVFQDLKLIGRAFGMPTTMLVDPAGCEIATLAGPAEWASEDALKLIGTALGKS